MLMNKRFTKVITLVLGLIVASGVGAVTILNSKKVSPVHAASDTLAMPALSSSDSNISADAAKSTGSNVPITATVNSQSGVRMYANNTLTISSSQYITSLTIPWYKNGSKTFAAVSVESGGGTYTHASSSGNSGTWTGCSKQIVLKIGSSGQIQLYQIQYVTTTAEFTLIKDFVTANMHMSDVSPDDNSDTNACRGENGYYLTAKRAWNTMIAGYEGEEDLETVFRTNFADAYNRYLAWASACADSAPFDRNDEIQTRLSAKSLATIIGNNSNTVAIIVIISTISVTAIGGYFFLRKRKEN